VVDYVSIEKTNVFNLTELVQGTSGTAAVGGQDSNLSRLLWDPNFGIQRQLDICLGNQEDEDTWMEFASEIQERVIRFKVPPILRSDQQSDYQRDERYAGDVPPDAL
jgi:hypothetical protein